MNQISHDNKRDNKFLVKIIIKKYKKKIFPNGIIIVLFLN